MPVCSIVKLIPLGTVDDLMHYCNRSSTAPLGNSFDYTTNRHEITIIYYLLQSNIHRNLPVSMKNNIILLLCIFEPSVHINVFIFVIVSRVWVFLFHIFYIYKGIEIYFVHIFETFASGP